MLVMHAISMKYICPSVVVDVVVDSGMDHEAEILTLAQQSDTVACRISDFAVDTRLRRSA